MVKLFHLSVFLKDSRKKKEDIDGRRLTNKHTSDSMKKKSIESNSFGNNCQTLLDMSK